MAVETLAETRSFGGRLLTCRHDSAATGTPMRFSLFLPAGDGPFPLLVWLSGLTCTEENFTAKAGAYRAAAAHSLAVVAPDTSPRGDGVADDPDWALGQGAGFYVNATEQPWAQHFQMERYVVDDVPAALAGFPVDLDRRGISGHSMGGHGALTLALRHPDRFRSVSVFSPIASPARCPWGEKALTAYLGPDRERWREHDASLLLEAGAGRDAYDDILIDQGEADPFLAEQLKPQLLREAAHRSGQGLTHRTHPGYDHSYAFVATFIDDHIAWHAERLQP